MLCKSMVTEDGRLRHQFVLLGRLHTGGTKPLVREEHEKDLLPLDQVAAP